jgi:hypothetical protein
MFVRQRRGCAEISARRHQPREDQLASRAARQRLGDCDQLRNSARVLQRDENRAQGCRERPIERRVLAKNVLLELLERRTRLDPEFRDEFLSRPAIDVEGFGLATVAIEREHQLCAQPLAKAVCSNEVFELDDDSSVSPEIEFRLDPQLERVYAQFLEPRDRRLRERFIGEVH